MKRSILGLLVSFIFVIEACTAATPTPTVAPTVACKTHTSSVVLSAPIASLKIGDSVKVTVTLNNEGCVALGTPLYSLYIQSDKRESIFAPNDPELKVLPLRGDAGRSDPSPLSNLFALGLEHFLAVAPGQFDTAEFDLQAIATGQAIFTASASFEVHQGYPGPAYWGYSKAGELLTITVAPSLVQLPASTPVVVATPTFSAPTETFEPNAEPTTDLRSYAYLDTVEMFDAMSGWGTMLVEVDGESMVRPPLIVYTADGGERWQLASPPRERLYSDAVVVWTPFFLDADHAWVAMLVEDTEQGRSALLWRTTDGGQNWESIRLPDFWYPDEGLNLAFADAQHGWLMHSGDVAMGHTSVAIFATMDGGQSWQEVTQTQVNSDPGPTQLPTGCYKQGLRFRDASTGWVSGPCAWAGFLLAVTHDGGRSWQPEDLSWPADMIALEETDRCEPHPPVFSSPQDGVVTIECEASAIGRFLLFYRTRDGGHKWDYSGQAPRPGHDPVFFADADNVWYISFDETNARHLSVTHDSGQTWAEIAPDMDWEELLLLDFANPGFGWAGRYGDEAFSLLKTEDGGLTWRPLLTELPVIGVGH